MKRLLGVLAVLALPLASASAADSVKQVESSTSGQAVSDRVRYVSWTVGTGVRVLDDQSGAVASYPLPAGCRAPSALGRGVAASVCGTRIQLLNVVTGTSARMASSCLSRTTPSRPVEVTLSTTSTLPRRYAPLSQCMRNAQAPPDRHALLQSGEQKWLGWPARRGSDHKSA
jgi:hypothetical protein